MLRSSLPEKYWGFQAEFRHRVRRFSSLTSCDFSQNVDRHRAAPYLYSIDHEFMRWFFIIILSWAWAFTNAQDQSMMGDAAEQNLRTLGSHGSNDQIRTFNNRYEGVRGSPFLRDLWHHAVIITTKGDSLLTYIKLDIYSDDVWAILSRGDSIVVDKGLIRSLSFFDEDSGRQRTFFFD